MTTILMAPPHRNPFVTVDGKPGRRIEWLGEASPMDDPFLWTGIAVNRFTPEMVALVRRATLRRRARTRDTWRSLGIDDPGLSRDYIWDHRNGYTVVVSYADAHKILSCSSGHEFRDLDATDPDDPGIVLPPKDVQIGSTVLLKEISREVMRANGSVSHGL